MGFWEPLFFWILAVGALGTSVAVLLFRNPLYSALALVADLFCFAGLYVLLSAHFMAVIQVLVYGGAILVLFLFIIMLLNLSEDDLGPRRFSVHQILAGISAAAVFAFAALAVLAVVDFDQVDEATAIAAQEKEELAEDDAALDEDVPVIVEVPSAIPGLYTFLSEDALQARYAEKIESWEAGEATYATGKYDRFDETQPFVVPPAMLEAERPETVRIGADGAPAAARSSDERDTGANFGTVEPVSYLLVNRFVIPFELTAILLLAAIVGAVIIAKKRL
jgi:NADH:ubiquinone oxidoreductase subunit 6 (subunit J)